MPEAQLFWSNGANKSRRDLICRYAFGEDVIIVDDRKRKQGRTTNESANDRVSIGA
jgi:hypothetical protein